MVFSIIIILFIGIIAFFHYVQGFFSATISAMLVILSAVLAVSYHETVVSLLLKGQMADMAHGMVLCMIFAVCYIFLRVIFDAAIPGNVRTPSTVDKVGAALMGIIAGVFVTGIFAIGVETLPFGPAISFMHAERYVVRDNLGITVPTKSQYLNSNIYDQMDDNALTADKQKSLLLPVDDWVLDTVYHLSDGGSLAGERSLASVHPDYLQELFGERLGIQTGARRSVLQFAGHQVVDITGIYSVPTLPAADGMMKELRPTTYQPLYKDTVKPGPGQTILVVRVKIENNATDDDDHIFRFSTGSIHMVGKSADEKYRDYYPIGTLQNNNTVLLDKPDDFLFVKEDHSFDAVFVVDSSLVEGGKDANHIAHDVKLTIKRFATFDLTGTDVLETIPSDPSVEVLRNPVLMEKLKLPAQAATPVTAPRPVVGNNPAIPVAPNATPSTPDAVTPPAPVVAVEPQKLPGKDIASSIKATVDTGILAPGTSGGIGVSTAGTAAADSPVAGGTVTFGKTAGAISAAKIDPTVSLTKLSEGASSLTQLYCPPDRVMVQIAIKPYKDIGWAWIGQLGSIYLLDTNGNKYGPNGCYELAKVADSQGLFLRYDADHALSTGSPEAPADGDIYLIFLVPKDTDIKTITVGAKQQDLDAPVHAQ